MCAKPGALAASFTRTVRIDPARLARGLAEACERIGVTIYERSEALEVGPGRVRYRKRNGSRRLRSARHRGVRRASSGQHRRFLPLYSFMIATEPLPAAVWDQLGWRDGLLVADRRHLLSMLSGRPTTASPLAVAERPTRWARQNRRTSQDPKFGRDGVRAAASSGGGGCSYYARVERPVGGPRDWCMSVTFDRGRPGLAGQVGIPVMAWSPQTCRPDASGPGVGNRQRSHRLPWVNHRSGLWEPEPCGSRLPRNCCHTGQRRSA